MPPLDPSHHYVCSMQVHILQLIAYEDDADEAVILIGLALDGHEVVRLNVQKSDSAADICKRMEHEWHTLQTQVLSHGKMLKMVLPDGNLFASTCQANPSAKLSDVIQVVADWLFQYLADFVGSVVDVGPKCQKPETCSWGKKTNRHWSSRACFPFQQLALQRLVVACLLDSKFSFSQTGVHALRRYDVQHLAVVAQTWLSNTPSGHGREISVISVKGCKYYMYTLRMGIRMCKMNPTYLLLVLPRWIPQCFVPSRKGGAFHPPPRKPKPFHG